MKHWMLDLECLGDSDYPAISEIGLLSFDIKDIVVTNTESLDLCISIPSLLREGFEITQKTWDWWSVQKGFFGQVTGTLDIKEALQQVQNTINFEDYIWSHATYDTSVLTRAFNKLKMKIPWSRRNELDLRTIRFFNEHLKLGCKKIKYGTKHNAQDDCMAQAITLQKFMKTLRSNLEPKPTP